MKTHENLPALNKYTSQTQYEALLEIDKSKSILGVVLNGSSSKTLGALVRCMWIKQTDYTDDNGVMREGWFVTDDGKHAMNVYKVKYEREQEEARKYQERVDKFEGFLLAFAEVSNANEPKIASLREELAELEKAVSNAKNEVVGWANLIDQVDQNRILNKHNYSIKRAYKEPTYRKYGHGGF
jgi:hypothetical protein